MTIAPVRPTTATAVQEVLELVTVEPDGLRATVGAEEIDAKTSHELQQRLGHMLYEWVHVGRILDDTAIERDLRDPRRDRSLAAVVPHRHTLSTAQVLADEGDHVVLHLDGLRVRVPRDSIVGDVPERGSVTVRTPASRPALSPGFFLVDGAWARIGGSPLLRLYVNLVEADAAPALWERLLGRLAELRVPYRAKICSADGLLPRRDAAVVYLPRGTWRVVPELADAVRDLPGLGVDVSSFVHPVAPGVGVAWEPADARPGRRNLSFGEHRANVLAEALIAQTLHKRDKSRETVVMEALIDASIDPRNLARNVGSPRLADIGLG